MSLSEIAKTPYAKTGLAVLAALVVYRFIDLIWFAGVVGVACAVAHHFITKAGGVEKAWAAIREWLRVDFS